MKKRTKISLSIILGIFVIVNLFWLSFYFIKYGSYTKSIPKHESGTYLLVTDQYDLSVKKPSYLSFTGNLAITNKEDDLSLLIWPTVGKNEEIGLQIKNSEGVFYSVLLDSNLNYDEKNNDSDLSQPLIESLINKRKSEINDMYSYAKSTWSL